MPLEQEQKEKISKALTNLTVLLNAFRLVIKAPDAEGHYLSIDTCKDIEAIIPDDRFEDKDSPGEKFGRKKVFYEKHVDLDPDLPFKGFFAHYIRPSTLHYKPKDYVEELDKVSKWVATWKNKLAFQENNPSVTVFSDNSSDALKELSDMAYRIVIDGGKTSMRTLHVKESENISKEQIFEDLVHAQKQSLKDYYIDIHRTELQERAHKESRMLEEYLEAHKNEIKKVATEEAVAIYMKARPKQIELKAKSKELSVKKYIEKYYREIKNAAVHHYVPMGVARHYIENHNKILNDLAAKAEKPVDDYLIRRNKEVDRRKDVLQLLVAEMVDNVKAVKGVLQELSRGSGEVQRVRWEL